MTMQHEAILYSLDPKILFSQIHEMNDYDRKKYSKLEERTQENNVHAMIASESDVHYKILPIRPRVQIFYYIGNISLLNQKILGVV
ncbi:MAG: hypothetical protein WCP92_02240 [bacterium]